MILCSWTSSSQFLEYSLGLDDADFIVHDFFKFHSKVSFSHWKDRWSVHRFPDSFFDAIDHHATFLSLGRLFKHTSLRSSPNERKRTSNSHRTRSTNTFRSCRSAVQVYGLVDSNSLNCRSSALYPSYRTRTPVYPPSHSLAYSGPV